METCVFMYDENQAEFLAIGNMCVEIIGTSTCQYGNTTDRLICDCNLDLVSVTF